MREILFRGKRIDNGEWIVGSLLIDPDTKSYSIYGFDYYSTAEGLQREPFCTIVDPTTGGQYTGLTDKNGKKIFEGDIVRNHNGEVYEFGFIECYSRFALKRPGIVFGWSNPKLCEIIGNIHDNPELLEADNG